MVLLAQKKMQSTKLLMEGYYKNLVALLTLLQNKSNLIFNTLAALFWCLLGIQGIGNMDTSWDSLAYHLPFASRLAGIFPKSEYLFYKHLEPLYEGQPKLGEFLQGIFWRLTGMVSAANLVCFFCILLLTVVTAKRLKISFWVVSLFFLSIPLVIIHSVTSYTDLPANSFLAIAFVNLLASYEQKNFDNKSLFLVLLPLDIAANIKFQSLEIAVPLWGFTIALFLFMNRELFIKGDRSSKTRYLLSFLLVNAISFFILGGNYMVNMARFNNPFYPLSVRIGSLSFVGPFGGAIAVDGPLSISRGDPNSQSERSLYKTYLFSITELKLWTNNIGRLWSVDMGSVWKDRSSPGYKSGGFFGVNLVLWGSFLLISFFQTKKREYLFWSIFVVCNFLFVGFLPAALLLRYWLFLPLDLAILTLWVTKKNPIELRAVFNLVLLLQIAIFFFVVYQNRNLVPGLDMINRVEIIEQYVNGFNPELKIMTDQKGYVCVIGDTRQGFLHKISNPDLQIQSAQTERECLGTTIIVIH